jgi:hypothetical protein
VRRQEALCDFLASAKRALEEGGERAGQFHPGEPEPVMGFAQRRPGVNLLPGSRPGGIAAADPRVIGPDRLDHSDRLAYPGPRSGSIRSSTRASVAASLKPSSSVAAVPPQKTASASIPPAASEASITERPAGASICPSQPKSLPIQKALS